MKLLTVFFCSILSGISLCQDSSHVRISTRWLDDSARAEKRGKAIIENYKEPLLQVRDGLRSLMDPENQALEVVASTALRAMESMIDRSDTSAAMDLLPFIDWLHENQGHPVAGLLGDTAAKGVLNYVVDGIFSARMRGKAKSIEEQEMEAMIRFYAGNPAQTSEGSWQTNNTMLFVFGDRVLNTLAKKAPDRIDAFYKAVLDARKSAQSGPGPDEEAILDADRPTAEQLRAYEATFVRLEALVATGTLPKADLPSQMAPTQTLPLPQAVPAVQPPPKQSAASSPSPTRSEELTSSTPWSVIVILMAAAIGLAWLLVKKRK